MINHIITITITITTTIIIEKIFVPYQGATQDGIVSPTLFNVIVDAMIREWYADVMDNVTAGNTGLSGDNVGCFMQMTVRLDPWILNGYRIQISISVIFFKTVSASSQILIRLKL